MKIVEVSESSHEIALMPLCVHKGELLQLQKCYEYRIKDLYFWISFEIFSHMWMQTITNNTKSIKVCTLGHFFFGTKDYQDKDHGKQTYHLGGDGGQEWEVEDRQFFTSEPEYEVHRIIDLKTVDGTDYYLVHWKGYGTNEQSWEPYYNLTNAPKKVHKFLQRQVYKQCCCL